MRLPSLSIVWLKLLALIQPGEFRIGRKSTVMRGARIMYRRGTIVIGQRAKVHFGAVLDAQKGFIRIGDNVSINPYSIIYGVGGVTIGNDVRIAAHTAIVSFEHDYEDATRPITQQGISKRSVVIEDDVWIGAGAKILAGARIARGCVIAANAVVKGETEPYGIYGGIPARLLKRRFGGQ